MFVFPKIYMLKANHNVTVLEVIFTWAKPSWTELVLSALIQQTPDLLHPFCQVRAQRKEFIHEPGHVPEPYTKSDSIWILDFADPTTARNQLPLFDPVYGILLYCWFQKKR